MNRAEIIEYPAEKLYTIGTVSKLTGVGAITLRAWERRYGLIKPVRKESGHRLYTRSHIDQINRITSLTQKGIRMSREDAMTSVCRARPLITVEVWQLP